MENHENFNTDCKSVWIFVWLQMKTGKTYSDIRTTGLGAQFLNHCNADQR